VELNLGGNTVTLPIEEILTYLPQALSVLGVFVFLAVVISTFKKRSRASARLKNRTSTMLIQLTKETGKQGEVATSSDQLREDIGVTETLFSAIGALPAKEKETFTFEIVAHGGLISFYVTTPENKYEFIEQQIHAQFPDAVITRAPDYNMFTPKAHILGAGIKMRRKSAFPIKTYKKLESDPLAGLTNPLTKLREHEGVAIQYVIRSAPGSWRNVGLNIARKLQKGKTLEEIDKEGNFFAVFSRELGNAMKSPEAIQDDKQKEKERRLSPMEEEMVRGLDEKSSKAGLEVNARLVTSSEDKERSALLLQNVLAAYGQFSIYEFGNSFEKSVPSSKKDFLLDFIYRTFDDGMKMVLNTEEMASLWHLPLPTTETPNINWLVARGAPPPPNAPAEGILLGNVEYRGTITPIRLKYKDRQRHMYLIGKSGSGKSTVMENMILQDMQAGRGVCVVDPHGELIDRVAGMVPPERMNDVVIFKPSDVGRPMGLNMLEAKTEEQKDFAAGEMIQIFYKLFPPEMIGPMFEHHMRNVMLTLMSDPENPGTITEIPRMFSDVDFQKAWRAKVKDPVVRSYWENEVDKTSDFHKSEMLGYLISKVGRFVENEMMRNIIGQQRSAFDFRDIMDNQKILFVNLSKGETGEINSKLLGMIIVTKLQMAAMSRANMPDHLRKDFYLYIDEFQNFVTDSIATILSEARKYRLNLIVAHQYLSQLAEGGKREVLDAVLGNVGTTLVSRIGPEDVDTFVKIYEPVFGPYDLINSAQYTWYVKMIIDNDSTRPFAMRAPPPIKPDREMMTKLYEMSRMKYGIAKEDAVADIMKRSSLGAKPEGSVEELPDPFAELLKG